MVVNPGINNNKKVSSSIGKWEFFMEGLGCCPCSEHPVAKTNWFINPVYEMPLTFYVFEIIKGVYPSISEPVLIILP